MADLLKSADFKKTTISRGQQIEGEVISISPQELVLDLGTKAEGVLQKKDLTEEQFSQIKIGSKITAYVLHTEGEGGQVILSLHKGTPRSAGASNRFRRFEDARDRKETLKGSGLEVNKGGLIVEVNGTRGFLPSSQIVSSSSANLDELVGKEIEVLVIEVDSEQNRLIFAQKLTLSEESKQKLAELKVGDQVKGEVAAVVQYGLFVKFNDGLEGFVHISELSWEKVEDPNTLFKVGDSVNVTILSIDPQTFKVNLSIKQLAEDPFDKVADKFGADDVVKGVVKKVTQNGVIIDLGEGFEGLIPTEKLDGDTEYQEGETLNVIIDSIDTKKRKINLAPFITSTAGLIYK